MPDNSDLEAARGSQDTTPDLASPVDDPADAPPDASSVVKKIILFLAIGVGVAGFVVLVIQFVPGLDSQPSVSRFRNVPPMEGPDILKAMMPGGQQSEMGPSGIDPLPAGIEVTREQNSLDHFLVADSFQAALVLQTRQILTSPVGEQLTSLLGEGLPPELRESIEADPASIESIIVLVDSLPAQPTTAEAETSPTAEGEEGSVEVESDPGDEESPDSEIPVPPAPMKLAVIVKLVEGSDAAEVATALTRSIPGIWREEDIGGKPGRINALPLPPPLPTGICIFDDQTLLVSSPATILEMLAAKGNSPLAGRLGTVNFSNDVVLVATTGILPEGILDGLDNQPLPPLAMLRELPGQLQAVSIAIRLTSEPRLQLELDSPDEAAARTVQNSIRGILPFMEIIVTAQKRQFTDNPAAPSGYVEMMGLLETLLRNSEAGRQDLTNVISISLSEEIIASLMTLPSMIEASDSWTDPDAEPEGETDAETDAKGEGDTP